MTSPTPLPAVTMDRIAEVMREHDVELWRDPDDDRFARAILNDLQVLWALLDSVLIVRADAPTGVPAKQSDPTLHLAAMFQNCSAVGTKAVVVDTEENLIVRTEAEVPIFSGATDEQLKVALKDAVDKVMSAHPSIVQAADQILKERRKGDSDDPQQEPAEE